MFRLDAGKQPLAIFDVGHPEHRAVAHAVHADQCVLDLGGIDVDPARDHHVALAVAQEQIAVGVEIADVADADEAVAPGFRTGRRVAVIVEIGNRGLPHEDLAGFVDVAKSAVGPEDFHDAALDGAADGAGLLQRLRRAMPDRDAGLGRAEILVDDEAPPVDHRALDVDRAGCRAMDDEAQRRDIVALAHLFG